MTLSKKVMKEVIESEKEVIERLTNRISFLEEQLAESNDTNKELLEKQIKMENILDSLGVEENFDDFIKYISFLYKNKNEFLEFLNIKNNKENILDQNYIDTKHKNNKNIFENIDFDSKIKKVLEEQKVVFDKELQERENKFNNYKREQEFKYNSLHDNFIKLEKEKINIPSPSSSTENKKSKNEVQDDIITLPNNLDLVVYYRHINNNSFLPSYNTSKNKNYLNCCNTNYYNKEITIKNGITCKKCYKTYELSPDLDKNNNHKLISNILQRHIINNEQEILEKIKCNLCNKIFKKETDVCKKCKCVEECIPRVTQLPDEKVGQRTAECFASETFNKLHFYDKVYNTAKEEKINVYEMKPLVEFIKKNDLMKEKQPSIIIKKILRSRYILDIYNEEKYINIHDIIKRIYINLDYIHRLDDYQFDTFKNNQNPATNGDEINSDINISEKNKINDKINNKINNKNINKNINGIDFGEYNRNCKKCLVPVTKEQFNICDKCKLLCIVDDCENVRDEFVELCNKHMTFDL